MENKAFNDRQLMISLRPFHGYPYALCISNRNGQTVPNERLLFEKNHVCLRFRHLDHASVKLPGMRR